MSEHSVSDFSVTKAAAAQALAYTHPDEVLHSTELSEAEKREILASWASDAHAVPNLPAMRQLDSGAIVALDTVLEALRSLDGSKVTRPHAPLWGTPARRTRGLPWHWRRSLYRRHRDGDDDPPPCPAAALPPGLEIELRRRRDRVWAGAAA